MMLTTRTLTLSFIAALSSLAIAAPTKKTTEAVKPKLEAVCIAIEPKVLQTKTAKPLPGSKSTILSPATETLTGLKILGEDEWNALGLTWEQFLEKSKAAATKHLATLKPQTIKDARGVVEYIKLTSDSELTSSVLISPELFKTFSPTLGSEIVVLVPDRQTVYLFPRRTGTFIKLGPEIAAIFASATYPGSDEAFELTESSLKSIGNFITDDSK